MCDSWNISRVRERPREGLIPLEQCVIFLLVARYGKHSSLHGLRPTFAYINIFCTSKVKCSTHSARFRARAARFSGRGSKAYILIESAVSASSSKKILARPMLAPEPIKEKGLGAGGEHSYLVRISIHRARLSVCTERFSSFYCNSFGLVVRLYRGYLSQSNQTRYITL